MYALALGTLVFHCLGTVAIALGAAVTSCLRRFRT
jgi:hypothetical protein